ncbi:MAG: hypothetical protein PHS96_00515 [Anaerolineales bacterium]|nr:hypothetical protein [Anaerolineales bacterium]
MRLRIAYDGWPLVHAPLSPAGFHLLVLMQNLPEEVQLLLLAAWGGSALAAAAPGDPLHPRVGDRQRAAEVEPAPGAAPCKGKQDPAIAPGHSAATAVHRHADHSEPCYRKRLRAPGRQ